MKHQPARHTLAVLGALILTGCNESIPTEARPDSATPSGYTAPSQPVNGEFIRQNGQNVVFLVYNQVLYAIPDMQTLRACTGGYENVVRGVTTLPAWPQHSLPSAGNPTTRPHGRAWIHGDRPVQASGGGAVYLLVGCVRSGIPSEAVYQATFGDLNWGRIVAVSGSDLMAFPEGPLASGVPLRRAGTLLNDGWVKWVTYHGGSLGVPDPATMDAYCRPWSDLINSASEHGAYADQWTRQGTSASCLRGNDYPFPTSNMNGVDPWNYYNRQCTSFAAWRLNQEGTEFHNMFRGYHFSNANTWDDAARSAGLPVNGTPKRGAVAQWEAGAFGASSAGHVAIVSAVHNDGTVTVEEYNWAVYGGYGTRRINAANVSNYIHFR
jgi:surface antigen